MRLIIRRGSIVHLKADAIVNAANSNLANGGGVAAALEDAAGPEFAKACKEHPFVPVGQAGHTPGFRLKATHVIHAVGPRWEGGNAGEEELLRSAYRSILSVAEQLGVRTLGVVPLSIGIFGYPPGDGCRVAIEELLKAPESIGTITLMAFKDDEYQLLRRLHPENDPAGAE
jgi:O-acetyl-ADP-ribose deacetylase (regulator of RNase III)